MYNAKIKFLYKTMNWTMCARTIADCPFLWNNMDTGTLILLPSTQKHSRWLSDTIRVWYIHHHICKHWLFLELSSCKYLDKVSILLRSLLIIGSKSNKAPDVSSRISATSLWNACTINAFTTKLKTKER